MFSHVDKQQVISMPDVNNIYKVPLMLFESKVAEMIAERLSLTSIMQKLAQYPRISDKVLADNDDQVPSIMQSWIELSERLI
jgi:CTP synthase (UTP-ammonia lyase)